MSNIVVAGYRIVTLFMRGEAEVHSTGRNATSHAKEGEPIASFRKTEKKTSNTLPDPEIKPYGDPRGFASCPGFALANTRPTKLPLSMEGYNVKNTNCERLRVTTETSSPDPGIEPETHCPVVVRANTRPTRQTNEYDNNSQVLYHFAVVEQNNNIKL
ncbi:hypothetical protein SFRURICE_012028, partial [Spodoptera frugiperda]